MPVKARLNDIVDALEMQFEETPSFLDLDTGVVATVTQELLGATEEYADDEEPKLPAWQYAEWELVKRIVFSGRFARLPSKFDVHEWEIMREFAESLKKGQQRDALLQAIHGSGAFRYFKDTVYRFGIEKAWSAFRTEALRDIAREWCEEHKIEWE
jgi:hypothetical protein